MPFRSILLRSRPFFGCGEPDPGEKNLLIVPSSESIPASLVVGLADRDASIWVRGTVTSLIEADAIAAMLRLPWKQVFIEERDPLLVAALKAPDSDVLARRRGFIHLIESDPSRIELPARALPVFLLSGLDDQGTAFEQQLRGLTMLEELRRSGVRQVVLVGRAPAPATATLDKIWATGFRTRLVVVDEQADAPEKLKAWLSTKDQRAIGSVVALPITGFASQLVNAFTSSHEDEHLFVRQRNEAGTIRRVDLTDIDDPERPILDNYDLIRDRDLTSADTDDLPEDAFNAFFQGELGDWRPFAAGVPWIRDDGAWLVLRTQLRRIDSAGPPENRITYIVSEAGAGGTTLARHLAFVAAKAGYPTLVAKGIPFTPDPLPLINFLTRAKQRSEDSKSNNSTAEAGGVPDSRLYETPWLLVFDRVHWEFRDTELRRFIQQLERAGRPACVLVVTGPVKEQAYFDESRFKQVTNLEHLLNEAEALALGKHINRFLLRYGKERPEWQWRSFQQAHEVRYLEGAAAFWVTLSFWLQTQYDLNDSIQDWVYKAYQRSADTPEVKRAVLQVAALSSERLPMPESLIEQGASSWPVPLLLDDRRSDLAPLGIVRLSNAGRKYWAMAHDVLGRLLINALFYDPNARSAMGYGDARDAQHLRFLILREMSRKPALGELEVRDYGEEFATNVFKVDPNHGRTSWNHIWREVLGALDEMPAPLRNGSRVFRHHTAISRRRIAWLDEAAYGVTDGDRVALLERAISDITYALQMIDGASGGEPDVNLYNSLANAYFDLARVRARQGALADELAQLRKLASDATRHAYEQSPSSPYVIETHVKSLIASAEENREAAPSYCIEALEIVYGAIRNDRNDLRRHALVALADRAVSILMSAGAGNHRRSEPTNATEVLVGAWIALAKPLDGAAPESLDDVPRDVLVAVLQQLDSPAGAGNAQAARLRYQVLVAASPLDFKPQLQALDSLVGTDYRLAPQLRLEYALLLFQEMRLDEADREFRALRKLWRETDLFVQVPARLRWLLQAGGDRRRVTATAAYDQGHRAVARISDFERIEVPYRAQEFDASEHRQGTRFSAYVSFGHNGPFLRPVTAARH